MPVVASFDPRPVVHLFLTEGEHRLKETPKADKQAWFQNVFQGENLTDDMEDYKKKKLQRCFLTFKGRHAQGQRSISHKEQ